MTAALSSTAIRLRAAELIEQCGWCQGGWCDGAGRICLSAALVLAADPTISLPPRHAFDWPALGSAAVSAMVSAMASLGAELGVPNLAGWNDEPGRTQAEVIAALRAEVTR